MDSRVVKLFDKKGKRFIMSEFAFLEELNQVYSGNTMQLMCLILDDRDARIIKNKYGTTLDDVIEKAFKDNQNALVATCKSVGCKPTIEGIRDWIKDWYPDLVDINL